ncbi:glutathione S-transferase 1-like [Haliotis cracherodii]|uniref:glutathione S-transferase 1-like n=1 Tax=Haliotis cracherodii TaxID=6455 RepID=UPI0039EBD650
MAEKMTLYYHPLYRSVRNIWLIKEMGVEEDFKLIHYKPNMDEAASIAYRRDVHPHGTIPALVIPGEGTMLESGAINMYLADRYGKLVPDPKDRKDYYDFIMYANSTLDELLEFFCDMWLLKVAETEERQARMRDKLNTCLDHLSNRLEGRDFLCGDKITAADCVLGYDIYVCSLLKDGELFQNHPKIREYLDRLKSRSAFQETTKDDQSYLQSLHK